MAERSAARRYAAAFLSLADEMGQVDALGADLDRVLEVAEQDDGLLLKALANPVFTSDERRAVLDALIPSMSIQPMTANLVRLMVDRNRLGALPDVVALFHEEADALAGRLRVAVETAEPLTGELEGALRGALEKSTGKQIVLDATVDPALIGGLVARIEGRVFDASVRARLNTLKHQLIHGASA